MKTSIPVFCIAGRTIAHDVCKSSTIRRHRVPVRCARWLRPASRHAIWWSAAGLLRLQRQDRGLFQDYYESPYFFSRNPSSRWRKVLGTRP